MRLDSSLIHILTQLFFINQNILNRGTKLERKLYLDLTTKKEQNVSAVHNRRQPM